MASKAKAAERRPRSPGGKKAAGKKGTEQLHAADARISYGGILICTALLSLFIGGAMANALFYICLLILPLSFLQVFHVSRRIRVAQKVEPMALKKGQRASFALVLRNRTFLPAPWVEVFLRPCPGFVSDAPVHRVGLLPGGRAEKGLPVRFVYRGLYRLGPERVMVRDAMRLFKMNVKLSGFTEVLVYPQLIELRRFSLSRLTEHERPRPAAQASDEALSETRKYIPGDTLSRIHWNLTARKQELTTRLFAQEGELRVLCLLDLRPFEAPDARRCEDAVIEAGLAAARFALAQGVPLTFACFEGSMRYVVQGRDLSRFQELYSVCAALSFTTGLPPSALLDEMPDMRYVMLFTAHNPSEELLRHVPNDAFLDVFRIRRSSEEALPPYRMAGERVRVFILDADERLAAEMEGAE